MTLTFLGTGTSHGIPVIGCSCAVCRSDNEKNRRTRASVWIEAENSSILIDTATEFRLQAVREGITSVDMVLLTHSHADHIHGIDDLRPLSVRKRIPVYSNRATADDMIKRFNYITEGSNTGGGKPNLEFRVIDDTGRIKFQEKSLETENGPGHAENGKPENKAVIPLPVKHGSLDVLGYRIGSMAYITDCSEIPEKTMKKIEGIEVMIIGALRYRPHPTHFSVGEAVEIIEKSGCSRGYITHMCHNIDHEELEKSLPPHIKPAFDGLKILFE